MSNILEKCENCGSTIGKLEKPHVWKDAIVCKACHVKLSADDDAPSGEAIAADIDAEIDSGAPLRSYYSPPRFTPQPEKKFPHGPVASLITIGGFGIMLIGGYMWSEDKSDGLRLITLGGGVVFLIGLFWFIGYRISKS